MLWSHIGILFRFLAAEPHSTTGHLFLSQRPCGMIGLPCIRWCETNGFQEQGQCFFIGLRCSTSFCLLLYFLSVYRLASSSCGLWADLVWITLSQPCTRTFFNNNNNNCVGNIPGIRFIAQNENWGLGPVVGPFYKVQNLPYL